MNNNVKITDHIEFREGLPFYDMVSSFMVALAACPAIFNKDNPMNLMEGHYIAVKGILVEGRHFRPYETYQTAQEGKISKEKFLKSCCCMLANTSYESVKDKRDLSPEFEFFRHIRNASSHQNNFHFLAHEPSSPACWRGVIIDHSLKGESNPLHGTECFGTFMEIADLMDLLKDIEKKIINTQLHMI